MQILKPFEKNWPMTQSFETKVTYMRSGIHSGIDWACPKGTELLACFNGLVVKTRNIAIGGYGRAVYLQSDDNQKVVALYGHCSKLLVKEGTRVTAGQIIALSGNSGFVISIRGDGSHLHFGLLVDGVFTDPLPYMAGFGQPAKPVKPITIPVKEIKEEKKENPYTEYTVKKGDTLYGIAQKKLGASHLWKELFDYNKDTIANPKHIRFGQVIKIPNELKK